MSLPLAVDAMVSVGQKLSMDVHNMRDLAVKMFVLSFKYVDRRALWDALFPPSSPDSPGAYVDWDHVGSQLANALGDLHLWLPLLDLCTWDGLERFEAAHPPLVGMRAALRQTGMDVGGNQLPCQLLILHMLHGVPSLSAFQLLTCRALKRDTEKNCALLLARLSDAPYTPSVYEALLALLLGPCLSVDVALLAELARASRARREGLSAAMRVRQMGACAGRPRLSDRATPTDEQKAGMDHAHGTWESIKGFCQLHQFPNVLSETVKHRLYFLAAQTQWDWRSSLPDVLPNAPDMCARIAQFPVSRPDLRVLHLCVDALAMDGRPPFQQMLDFRAVCFCNFPASLVQRMTLSQVLRLYVCAYQGPHVWKDLWKLQLCLLTTQIVKACEAFVEGNPFAVAPFLSHFSPR
jgi:hypothetical protein